MVRLICAVATALATGLAQAEPAGPAPVSPPGTERSPWEVKEEGRPPAPLQLSIRGMAGWFRIGIPQGWQLAADRISGRVRVSTADGRSVRMWPMFLPREVDAGDAVSLLRALNAQMAPKAPWSAPVVSRFGSRLVVWSQARDGTVTRVSGMTVVSSGGATRVLHAFAGAPAKLYAQNRAVFAAVMESFVPLPGSVAGDPALEQISFERWTDPVERAFSVDIPRGWTAQGGTVRKAAIDVRQTLQLRSADGTIAVFAGDAELPLFAEPGEKRRAGERDGVTTAMPFEPGERFIARYLDWRVRPLLPDLTVDAVRPLPQLQARLQAVVDAFSGTGLDRGINPGDATFHGTLKGRPATGYLFAATSRIPVPGREAVWTAGDLGSLFGFVATQDHAATATAVIERIWTSLEISPQWFRDNTRAIGAVSRLTAEARRHIMGTLARRFARGSATALARYGRHKIDVVPIRDPVTETDHMVQVGSNYYWLDDRGFLLGTEQPVEPDPLWLRELVNAAP